MIPGTVIPEQIVENMKATEIQLDQDDMERLRSIDRKLKFIDVSGTTVKIIMIIILNASNPVHYVLLSRPMLVG